MMSDSTAIALNFVALRTQAFSFEIFAAPCDNTEQKQPEELRYRLPSLLVKDDAEDEYLMHSVAFAPKAGHIQRVCSADTNRQLTLRYLFELLRGKCRETLQNNQFTEEDSFVRRVSFILQSDPLGDQAVWLAPHYLPATKEFGFLVDFRFIRHPDREFDRRALQLSLSLDAQFRDNSDFYVDRHRKVAEFLRRYHALLFPFRLHSGVQLQVETTLRNIKSSQLRHKKYVFRGDNTSTSQFMGIKQHGPLQAVSEPVFICFMYRADDKPLSYDLYRALRGDTYPTFPGMEAMFRFTLGPEHVIGMPVECFERHHIADSIAALKSRVGDSLVVPIVLTPWTRFDGPEASEAYYRLKHTFLNAKLPSQFVGIKTIADKRTFKWSIANIGLGIFSKLGGIPWRVVPENHKCLIIGIGQSHRRDSTGSIGRYFAYSVLTDSSGVYERLQTLSTASDEPAYLHGLTKNLIEVIDQHSAQFERFAIHAPFKLRRREMDAIAEAVRRSSDDHDREFVVLRFNDDSKYFGYAYPHNSMVPYESTYIKLSHTEYLVWFEGLQHHNPKLRGKVSKPVHIEFSYPPHDELSSDAIRRYLQDAVNLSGANWRGFNAKTLPVSVYYSQLLARFLGHFGAADMDDVDIEQITPWFL